MGENALPAAGSTSRSTGLLAELEALGRDWDRFAEVTMVEDTFNGCGEKVTINLLNLMRRISKLRKMANNTDESRTAPVRTPQSGG